MWLGAAFTICALVALAAAFFGLMIVLALMTNPDSSPSQTDDAMYDVKACGLVFLFSCVGLAFLAWLH